MQKQLEQMKHFESMQQKQDMAQQQPFQQTMQAFPQQGVNNPQYPLITVNNQSLPQNFPGAQQPNVQIMDQQATTIPLYEQLGQMRLDPGNSQHQSKLYQFYSQQAQQPQVTQQIQAAQQQQPLPT